MSNDLNKLDDLFDESINQALKKLGLVTPQTAADFKLLDEETKNDQTAQPTKLKDPFMFLNKSVQKSTPYLKEIESDESSEHSSGLAQAAREGKAISEEIKQQMQDDKKQSQRTKGE